MSFAEDFDGKQHAMCTQQQLNLLYELLMVKRNSIVRALYIWRMQTESDRLKDKAKQLHVSHLLHLM